MPKEIPTPEHRARCYILANKLIPSLRERARELGYALGVHGSLERDIDLIACPWATHAVSAKELAEALQKKAQELNDGIAFQLPIESGEYFQNGCPGNKPFGRRNWTFHLGGGPYIDLSVMPRTYPAYNDYPLLDAPEHTVFPQWPMNEEEWIG